MWYRVVTNKDGGIASCDVVEGQEHDGRGIFYVDAQTPAAACLAAKQMWLDRYQADLARRTARQRSRRDVFKSKGLCVKCGNKPPKVGITICSDCRWTSAGCGTGTPVARTDDERAARAKKQAEANRVSAVLSMGGLSAYECHTLRILKRILADFRRLSPPNAAPKFEGHLIAQIAELETKRQQKPEPKAQAAE